MNLKLRSIERREDVGRISAILETGMEATLRSLGRELPPGTVQRFLDRAWGRRETLVLVVEGPDGVVGLLATGPFEDPTTGETTPMVAAFFVSPSFRHRGIARALFAEAQRLLSLRGERRILARAAHNDDVLISMGERWGLVRAWELMAFETS